MDGRPNSRNKAAFSHFSFVVWTLPEIFKELRAPSPKRSTSFTNTSYKVMTQGNFI